MRVADGSGTAVFSGSVSLDSDGRGEVPSLRPGTYEVRAESSGYAPVSLPGVAVPSRTLSLLLTPGGSLEIQAGPATLALPQATGRLIGAGGRPYMWSAFTPDGKIRLTGPVRRLENVAPGRYSFEVEGGERREVTVSEGGRARGVPAVGGAGLAGGHRPQPMDRGQSIDWCSRCAAAYSREPDANPQQRRNKVVIDEEESVRVVPVALRRDVDSWPSRPSPVRTGWAAGS